MFEQNIHFVGFLSIMNDIMLSSALVTAEGYTMSHYAIQLLTFMTELEIYDPVLPSTLPL